MSAYTNPGDWCVPVGGITYHCEYEVTYSDGRIETFPNDDKPLVLIISPQIG